MCQLFRRNIKNPQIKMLKEILTFFLTFFDYKILNKKYKYVDEPEEECPEGCPYFVVHIL
jgi:hypothetical protein